MIISRLNRILDALPPSVSLNAAIHQRPNTPIEGLSSFSFQIELVHYKNLDVTINTTLSSSTGTPASFSSAALYAFSGKKTIALEEYCATVLATKLPKVLTKVWCYCSSSSLIFISI